MATTTGDTVPAGRATSSKLQARPYGDLASAIAARCERLPDAHVVGGQEKLRWIHVSGAAFQARMEALAADLQARGVVHGDRVVLWVPNGWRTPILFAAVWRCGAAIVPFDREMNVDAARTIVALVRPRLVITGYGQRPVWAPAAGVEEWWDPDTATGTRAAAVRVDAQDVAAIYFTSGTTGAPKGCTITHRNLLAQVKALPEVVPVGPGDVFGSILPLSHLFELTCGMLYPLLRGASVEYIPSRKGPDIVRVLKEQRVTHMVAVPQVLAIMGAAAAERLTKMLGAARYARVLQIADRSPMRLRRLLFWPVLHRLGGRLRMLACGGAALDPDVQRQWERMGIRTLQGYGASECSPIIACQRASDPPAYGTVGKPLPGVEVRFDSAGQLLARGPNVMRGYWEDPERTASAIDSDGYYATGDLCEQDATGDIRILGRAQELLVLPSGMNVWPEDVQEQLRRAPGVKDAVVILVRTATGGATLHAYLLPSGAADPALLPSIVATANGNLATHQRVATASWWPEEDFPRTSTMKVKRRLIPQPDETANASGQSAGGLRVDATLAADDPVLAAVRAVSGNATATDDHTLAGLGLDSLGITGLAVEIEERTGISVPEGTIETGMTVAQLRRAISAAGMDTEGAAPDDGPSSEPEVRRKRVEEGKTWLPPLWLYTRGRVLRRLSTPVDALQRAGVPKVITLGTEHLSALDRGVILAGTHRSYPDVPTIRRAIAESSAHAHTNRLVIAASSVIVGRAGILGTLVTVGMGLFPLRQYGGQEESLRRMAQIADAGNTILIFPQGHHCDPRLEQAGDSSVRFKPGIGRLAIDLELPVLPFGLAGTERVLLPKPPESFTGLVISGIPVAIRRHPVAIAFGAPLAPALGESATDFSARLQAVCFELSRQAEQALMPVGAPA